MLEESKRRRQEQIEDAAYDMLRTKGYAGTSMLSIAKLAKASNETLYRWYGDKLGLFRSLVHRNAAKIKLLLEQSIGNETQAEITLRAVGPILLALLTNERAVSLNRAAAADSTGALGAALSEAGRESIAPLIAQVLERGREEKVFHFDDTADAIDLYLGLLIGDLQIRRAIGRLAPLGDDAITQRADRAYLWFCQIVQNGPSTPKETTQN